jgi:NAD(P)-dependent dehydrogenase (short-subunit alcohol dehydrogenase family)
MIGNESYPIKSVVITGSTRGFGYGLADAFLARGCAVTISSRTLSAVEAAVQRLSAQHAPDRVLGQACDVREYEQVRDLWDSAHERFGQVDIWINNAGMAHSQKAIREHPPAELQAVVETNVIGLLYGTRVALEGMLAQGHGALYNVEGLGSTGRRVEGLTLYGSTKRAVNYINRGLAEETKGSGIVVGALSPGMMATDLLTQQYVGHPEEWQRVKRVFNLLADRVEDVAPWMVDRILGNEKNGVRIRWLTPGRLLGRLLALPFRRRDVFQDLDA